MLLDPCSIDSTLVVGTGHDWQSPCAATAGHRSAAGFLTLPALEAGIAAEAEIRRRESASFNDLVLAHFKYGPLRGVDVNNPVDSGDAFQQAFFAWLGRHLPPCKRLVFMPRVVDSNAVRDAIEYLENHEEFEDTSPLYLTMVLECESMYRLGERVEQLKNRHPLLVYTMLSLIEQAGYKTLWVRTPSWYLYELACFHWEGDDSAADEDVKYLLESNGEDGNSEDAHRYLPSNVRPELLPEEHSKPERISGRRRRNPRLSEPELLALRKKCRGLPRTVCTELIHLTRLLQKLGKRSPLTDGY